MSKVTISYSSLKSSSSEAKQVSKKLKSYAKNLDSAIYKKLNKYTGDDTTNISTAKSKTQAKIDELEARAEAFSNYADDLTDLRDECLATDKSVKSKVSKLTASFKVANGIRNSKVQNALNYCLTSFGNSTVAGRWVGNATEKFISADDYIKQSIKEWWNYDGGKQLIKGVVEGILGVAIAVCTFIAAITSGAALVVIIAGAVAGVIAIVNGFVNIANEGRAYNETKNNGNPALGRRRSNENTMQDTIRRESDSSLFHGFATGIDVINFGCTVITFGNSAKNLFKDGKKWITKNNVFSKEFFTNSGNKIKTGFSDIKTAIKLKDSVFFKGNATKFLNNLKNNLFISFNNAGGNTTTQVINSIANSTKNILTIPKNLLKGDSFKQVFTRDFLIKGLPVFTVDRDEEFIFNPLFTGGESSVLTTKDVTVSSIYSIVDTWQKNIIGDSLFKSNTIIDSNILSKLSTSSSISISVPEINIPEISFCGV